MAGYALSHIKKMAASGEGHFLEFKRKVDDPRKIVKELVAFSNADGGKLVIGISDNGSIPGLPHPEGDWFILEKALKNHIKGGSLKFSMDIVSISGSSSVIVLDIQKGKRKPLYFQEKKNDPREVYIRVKDECVRASREMADLLSYERRRIYIEYGPEEEWLLSYLQTEEEVTLDTYWGTRRLPRKQASRILVRLTAAGVLDMIPGYGREDRFKLA